MSTLVIDEFYPGVVFAQGIIIKRDTGISHVRPWITKWGTLASGVFTCRVKDGNDLVAESTIDYTQINEIASPYAHGFVRFDFNNLTLLLSEGEFEHEYTFEFELVGGIADVDNFIAMARSWENKIYTVNEVPVNDMIEPGGVEIYEFKENL